MVQEYVAYYQQQVFQHIVNNFVLKILIIYKFYTMNDYLQFDDNNDNNDNTHNYRKYIITGVVLYLPLITLNVVTYITLYNIKQDVNNLINDQDNIEYINKVKYLVDYICNTIDC